MPNLCLNTTSWLNQAEYTIPIDNEAEKLMITAKKALDRLKAGNRRFVSGSANHLNRTFPELTQELTAGQKPFAVVLGCSDSRVPVEIVFDQGVGDLFVVRIAGNILSPAVVGSIEFATTQFGCPLVLVLGHSNCGAVQATVERIDGPAKTSSNLNAIVEWIQPVVEEIRKADPDGRRDAIVARAVRANVRHSADALLTMSPVLAERVERNGLLVCGGEFILESGEVDVFYRRPEPVERRSKAPQRNDILSP